MANLNAKEICAKKLHMESHALQDEIKEYAVHFSL